MKYTVDSDTESGRIIYLNPSSEPVHADFKSTIFSVTMCLCRSNNNLVTLGHFGPVFVVTAGRQKNFDRQWAVDLLAVALITGTVWIVLMLV
jgi:hypothetical protein